MQGVDFPNYIRFTPPKKYKYQFCTLKTHIPFNYPRTRNRVYFYFFALYKETKYFRPNECASQILLFLEKKKTELKKKKQKQNKNVTIL